MSLATVVLLAGVACLLAGIVLGVLQLVDWALRLQAAAIALLGSAALALLLAGESVGAAFRSEVGPAVGLDPLSSFFVVVLSGVALPALALARDSLPATPARGAIAARRIWLEACTPHSSAHHSSGYPAGGSQWRSEVTVGMRTFRPRNMTAISLPIRLPVSRVRTR